MLQQIVIRFTTIEKVIFEEKYFENFEIPIYFLIKNKIPNF